jgi:hypothetical protein
LTDIGNTRKIRAVFLNGRYLNRAQLDQLQSQIQEAASRSR